VQSGCDSGTQERSDVLDEFRDAQPVQVAQKW